MWLCWFVDQKTFNNFETINQIKLMAKSLSQGPDDNKFWVDGQINIGLGFQRLSIQDLSSQGSQPIESVVKDMSLFLMEKFIILEFKK